MDKNPERTVVGLIIILIIAFTPIIAWFVTSLGLNSEDWGKYVIRGLTGVITYIAAVYAISGLREPKQKVEKEGKVTVHYYMLIAGIAIIAVAWFTDISELLITTFGLQWEFEIGGTVYANTSIPARLFTSLFTFLGALLIKNSIKRKRDAVAQPEGNSLALYNAFSREAT